MPLACGGYRLPPCSSGSVGGTGLSVSRLGLGTMTWGRDTDEHEARDQLIAFVEAGGTLVDTAAGYTDGDSEQLIGSLIGDVVRPRRASCSPPRPASSPARASGSPTPRAATCSARSTPRCKRLGVDHVDLWQVHIWTDDDPARGDAVARSTTR